MNPLTPELREWEVWDLAAKTTRDWGLSKGDPDLLLLSMHFEIRASHSRTFEALRNLHNVVQQLPCSHGQEEDPQDS